MGFGIGFDLRARASDRFGNQSGWSPVHHLIVDTVPPTVTADTAVDDYLADGYITAAELIWTGQAVDDHEVRRVAVCLTGDYTTACESASTSLAAPDHHLAARLHLRTGWRRHLPDGVVPRDRCSLESF